MTHDLRENTRKALVAMLLASAFAIGGCKSAPPSPSPNPVQTQQPLTTGPSNPALNSDGTTIPAGQQASPQAAAPNPASSQPAPPPPLVAPVGTSLVIRTNEALSASHNEVGDSFSGELSQPVIVHRATVFARGTRVIGTVVAAKGRGRFKGSGALGIELTSIDGIHVQTSEYEKELQGKGKRTGGLIGGGAGLGALIGGIAGGGKGALIGGLAGAGAGTAGAAYTGNKDVILPSESLVTFRLAAPLTVKRNSAP